MHIGTPQNTGMGKHTLTHSHTKQINFASQQRTKLIIKLAKLFSFLEKPNNSYDKVNIKFI